MEALRLFGRDELLSRVSAELDRPHAVIALVGDPGVGKTTVWTVALTSRPAAWSWSVRCLEVEAQLGLAVVTDLFAALPESIVAELPALQRHAVEVVLCREEERDEGQLGTRMLGMTALTALRALSSSGPVVLGVDDLQWCDPTSLEALSFALHRLGDADVTALTTRRSDSSTCLPRTIEIDVEPLTPGATKDLVLAVAPSADPSRVRAVIEASRGNPLFAKELARQTRAIDGVHERLPSSLRETLNRRLAPLPIETRLALVDVAVRGAPSVAELRVDQLDGDLDEAFRADLVVVDNGRVRFTHPLIAAAVLAGATPGELRAAHRRAADAATDPMAEVLHRLEYEPASEALAGELDAAVKIALQRGDQIGARNLAERALEMSQPDQEPRRLHQLLKLVGGLGDNGRATELASALLKNPGTPDAQADALMWMTSTTQDVDDSIAVLNKALEVPDISPNTRELILYLITGYVLYNAGRILEAIAILDSVLDASPHPADQFPGLVGTQAWLKRLAGMPEQRLLPLAVHAVRARIAAQAGVPAPHSDLALGAPGVIAVLDDRYADAVEPLREATFAATRAGEADGRAFYGCLLALREGRLSDAQRMVDGTITVGGHDPAPFAHVALLHAWRGDHQAAAEAVATGRRLSTSRNVVPSMEIDFAAGFDAVLRRDYVAAVPPLRAAAELMERIHYREPSHPPVLPAAVEAAAAVGEIGQAQLWCERLERNAELLHSRFGNAAARRSRGCIAEAAGRFTIAEECHREAADRFAEIGVPLEQARTLLALGGLLRRTGRRRLAREALETAGEIFTRCGAVGLAADAVRDLHRLGGRTPGSNSELTASERQVAECVARGMSNAEVAQSLHLSVKTVETHLSHVYRKLRVTSRGGLAHALDSNTERTGVAR